MVNDKQNGGIDIKPSSGNGIWEIFTVKNVHLAFGKNRVKVFATKGGFKFETIDIRAVKQ